MNADVVYLSTFSPHPGSGKYCKIVVYNIAAFSYDTSPEFI